MKEKISNEKEHKLKKYKKVIIPLTATAVTFIALNSLGVTNKIVTTLKDTYQKALEVVFNTQENLEINRDNTPQIEVNLTNKTVTLIYDNSISEMQYRIDGENEDWKVYTGAFSIEENVIIQTRYKKQGDTEYTIGSSKVITDLNYNISLAKPEVTVTKETTDGTEKGKIVLNSTDEEDKTIVYEVSITRYSLNEEGLLNSDGSINEAAVSKKESVSYSKLEESADGLYKKIDNKNIEISKSGIYKIKVRASTNGGFVKSEEVEKYLKIDNVVVTELLTFKKATSNTTYQFDKTGTNEYTGSCSEEDIVVSLNINDDIIFGNSIVTYNGIALSKDTQNPIETITGNGWHKRIVTLKIGAANITYTYNIKIGHTAGVEATCTTDQICTDCGIVLAKKTGHTAGAEATCTTDQICTKCGEVIKAKLGHNTSGGEVQVKAATCITDGTGYYTCSRCGKNSDITYSIPATGKHNYTVTVKTASMCLKCQWYDTCGSYTTHKPGDPATCTTAQTCTDCQYELAAKLGHVPTGSWKKGSETAHYKSCSRCGGWATSASHKKDDYTTYGDSGHYYVCNTCNSTYGSIEGHTMQYVNLGSSGHQQRCTACQYAKAGAISHTTTASVTKPATCGSSGTRTYKCKYCPYTSTETIPATGMHSYTTTTIPGAPSSSDTRHTCRYCGHTYVD